MHYPRGEGLKAHSKGGRDSKRSTQEVRARRGTRKEAGLENAIPNVVEGFKAHLKGGKVRKYPTQGGRGL
jgi:hypothetical protein